MEYYEHPCADFVYAGVFFWGHSHELVLRDEQILPVFFGILRFDHRGSRPSAAVAWLVSEPG
jgi:hypothetical protein